MKKLLAIALVAFSLAGCATVDKIKQAVSGAAGFTVTQQQLDGAVATYDGTSLVAMDKYAALVRCPAGKNFTVALPCHDPKTLKDWRAADKSVAKAFNDTQDMITSGNNTGALAAWNVLQSALTVVSGFVTKSGASALIGG